MADYQFPGTPSNAPVTSVAGKTGAVSLVVGDVTGAEATANKDAANGYAGLDAGTKLKTSEVPSRVTTTFQTASSIGPGVTDSGAWTMAKSLVAIAVTVDVDSRVRLYSTAAARDADVGRGTLPPTAGTQSELILDLSLAAATTGLVWVCTPAAMGSNADGSPNTNIYYNVTNNSGSAHQVQVTIKYLILES
jgi:hypothetical protein